MKLDARQTGDVSVLSVRSPRIDAASAIRFKDLVRENTTRSGARVRLDLQEVDFIDSSGLGAIVAVMKLLAPSKRLELCSLAPMVSKVFSLTRMDQVFVIHESVEDGCSVAKG